jgi:acetyl esterase/lipase
MFVCAATRAAEPLVVDLRPGKAPGETGDMGAEKVTKNEKMYRITNVSTPTLTIYRPAKDTGTALIIAPGGAYQFLSWDIEGENIAKWCNDVGVTGIILKYRVPRRKDNTQAAFQDGQRAVSLTRAKAAEWGVNPKRIGMIGFSAGAGVTGFVLLNSDKRSYEAVDDADKASDRLDYGVLIYGGGFGGKSEEKPASITKDKVPPIFLCAAYNDGFAAEAAAQNFLMLKRAGVPAELHIYASGGHGFGIRPQNSPLIADWSNRLEGWMRHQNLLEARR